VVGLRLCEQRVGLGLERLNGIGAGCKTSWRLLEPDETDEGISKLGGVATLSPLVDGPHVVVSPGGPGAGMVKLDKMTGKTVWMSKELGDTAAYSSITFNNKVFFTSGYGAGGALLDLTVKDGEVAAAEVYHTNDMRNHHGGVVLVDGHLYGFSDLILTCLEFATGKVVWRDRSVGKGSVTYANGHLYIQSENNMFALAEATTSGYREKGRFAIPEKGQMSWAHPAISDGRLYVRNQDTLLVYDIKPTAP